MLYHFLHFLSSYQICSWCIFFRLFKSLTRNYVHNWIIQKVMKTERQRDNLLLLVPPALKFLSWLPKLEWTYFFGSWRNEAFQIQHLWLCWFLLSKTKNSIIKLYQKKLNCVSQLRDIHSHNFSPQYALCCKHTYLLDTI